MHGGKAPQSLLARTKREEQARIERMAVTYGVAVKIDPLDALAGELWRTQGVVLWLESQVRELAPEALTWGIKEVQDKRATEFTGTDTVSAAQIHGLVELYFRERQHLHRVSKDCVSVGIALKEQERMGALADQVLARMRALATWLGADVARPEVMRTIVEILRTGEPPPRSLP